MKYNLIHIKLFILFSISLLTLACSSETSEADKQEFLNADDLVLEMNEIAGSINSTHIGTIEASTNAQHEIQFKLLNSNPAGALEVDSNTGDINMLEVSLFNYEFFPVITAEIEVSANDLVKNIKVNITLKDRVESNGFIYKNKKYSFNKIRELQSARRTDGKLEFDIFLASPGIEFFNISGVRGQGEYLQFSFYAGNFHPSNEINEGVFNFDMSSNSVRDVTILNTDYNSDLQSPETIYKDISEAKIVYKRTDYGADPIPQRKSFSFDIKFILFLTDGSVVSGDFKGVGNSSYFTL